MAGHYVCSAMRTWHLLLCTNENGHFIWLVGNVVCYFAVVLVQHSPEWRVEMVHTTSIQTTVKAFNTHSVVCVWNTCSPIFLSDCTQVQMDTTKMSFIVFLVSCFCSLMNHIWDWLREDCLERERTLSHISISCSYHGFMLTKKGSASHFSFSHRVWVQKNHKMILFLTMKRPAGS